MSDLHERENQFLAILVELLDIPRSYYEKAKDRARALEEWLQRDGSLIADFSPDVYPQGSFRYGTVIRPLFESDYYDLDLVCAVLLSKANISQKKVKELIGHEIQAYADAKQFNDPAEEKPRCWRLNYADAVSFHMDILPSVPEDPKTIELIVEQRVPRPLAELAIAITDNRHRFYEQIDSRWFSSNPRGIARWFEAQARAAAQSRISTLVENRAYASVEEVPPYEWKTTLQRSIQILKRHRDVMFLDNRDLAPISMIITTLAAHAYGGEQDLYSALTNILEGMPNFVRSQKPRIPNPVNPGEDFAERWARDSKYEDNFRLWHAQVKADLSHLFGIIDERKLANEVGNRLKLDLTDDHVRDLQGMRSSAAPRIVAAPTVVSIPSASRPWRRDA